MKKSESQKAHVEIAESVAPQENLVNQNDLESETEKLKSKELPQDGRVCAVPRNLRRPWLFEIQDGKSYFVTAIY